jgi:hypothetical protein
MADLSELFDYSFDLETAVIQLSTFLERLAAASPRLCKSNYDGKLHFTHGLVLHRGPAVELEKFVHDEVGPTLDAAYVTVENAAQHFPDFPVVEFMNSLVFRLDELVKATSRKTDFPDALYVACEAISREYPKFRAQLKLLELRAKHLPEAAPESERPAARRKLGRETKDLPRAVSDALLKRWNQRGENAQKREVWAADAAKWLKNEHGAAAPDGELWPSADVIRFLENAQERVRRKRR